MLRSFLSFESFVPRGKVLTAICFFAAGCSCAQSPPGVNIPVQADRQDAGACRDLNRLVLRAVKSMPSGGGYSTSGTAAKLAAAIQIEAEKGSLQIEAERAKPSFCSGATYLVFLHVVALALEADAVALSPKSLTALKVAGQADGAGVWGRWNSNGPGTAKFFHDLKIGVNFTALESAVPGDFLKIWWTDEIGSKERGHSVIFMGTGKDASGEQTVKFWSSNQDDGYGEKVVLLSKAKRMLFSRLTSLRELENVPALPAKDAYLEEMLKRPSTEQEMFGLCGVREVKQSPPGPPPVVHRDLNPAPSPAPIDATPIGPVAAKPPTIDELFYGGKYARFARFGKIQVLRRVQSKLAEGGHYNGTPDGDPGAKTDTAIKIWQKLKELPVTGRLDDATLKSMGLDNETEEKVSRTAGAKPLPAPPAIKP